MKIIFAGTPDFSVSTLHALIDSHHDIVGVLTQPDKPSGRGLKLTQSPVKALCLANHLPLFQPKTLKEEEIQKTLRELNADVMVVAAYGLLLPPAVLTIPTFGCINVHPSLLPRFRGAAPIQRTVHAGDPVTGVTIMQMEAGLDTGPILLQTSYTLKKHETSQSLHDELKVQGANALIETLNLLEQNKLIPKKQDDSLATYADKISKEEALIDWQDSAIDIDREIRAFNPWPIAYTSWQNDTIRIWQAEVIDTETTKEPRTILHAAKDGIDIATGKGILRLLQVQLPGGKALSAADFYNAKHELLIVGKHFI